MKHLHDIQSKYNDRMLATMWWFWELRDPQVYPTIKWDNDNVWYATKRSDGTLRYSLWGAFGPINWGNIIKDWKRTGSIDASGRGEFIIV